MVGDMHTREGVVHFRIRGKGSKIRCIPVNPAAQRLIEEYLEHRDIEMMSRVRYSGR
jgi:integrase/recombinase XerD